MNAKLYVGTLAAAIWVAAVIGKHFWPDLAIDAIVSACGMVLAGLGAYHMGGNAAVPEVTVAAAPPPAKEGGFARLPLLVLIALIAGASLLTGCSSMNGKFENRVACTVAKDRAYVVSEWGPVGITGQLADQDRVAICK